MSTETGFADAQETSAHTPMAELLHEADVLPDSVTTISDLARQRAWFNGDGRMRSTLERDDIRHDNTRRAGFGAHALTQTAIRAGEWSPKDRGTGPDPKDMLTDLLAYLRHTADSLGLDYEEIDVEARRGYLHDLRGE